MRHWRPHAQGRNLPNRMTRISKGKLKDFGTRSGLSQRLNWVFICRTPCTFIVCIRNGSMPLKSWSRPSKRMRKRKNCRQKYAGTACASGLWPWPPIRSLVRVEAMMSASIFWRPSLARSMKNFPEDIVRRAEVIYTFEVDKTPVRKWAAALASHPQFSRCKTYSQRSYLLETMAGDEYGNLPVDEIISLADAMYTIDVLPKEEERLRTEAHRLRKQGLSLTAISGKLGISRDRVYAFLPGEKKRRRKLNLPDQSPQRRVRRAPHRKVAGPHGLSARRRARV